MSLLESNCSLVEVLHALKLVAAYNLSSSTNQYVTVNVHGMMPFDKSSSLEIYVSGPFTCA